MDDYKECIKKIAESVKKNKYDWVLVLGTGVSYDGMADADNKFLGQILQMQQEYEKQEDSAIRKAVSRTIQERKCAEIKEILYGDVWNEVSFLYTEGEQRQKHRKDYAKCLAVKEEMNLEYCPNLDLRTLLEIFPGIVLTTCQDETVEAFLEDESCMSIENRIYTPDILATLPYWEKWAEDERVLVKLYGTCRKPQLLLLTEKDLNMYYPNEDGSKGEKEESLYTMEALNQLFQNKNLFFLGIELPEKEEALNREPVLAEGISRMLKKEIKGQEGTGAELQRYIILQDKKYEELWRERHTTSLICEPKHIPDLIKELKIQIDSLQVSPQTVKKRMVNEAAALDRRSAEAVFWSTYNRRSKHHISKREKHILESHIWNAPNETDRVNYSKEEIRLLAMAANNYAEFSDLWKVITMAQVQDKEMSPRDNAKLIKDILRMRIDTKGQKLLQLLDFYGEGFPMGFLSLISENEKELKDWKRAGIQLTNSGIYIQLRNRKKIYEQIEYADSLMRTAGSRPHQREFGLRLQEKKPQMDDSYFYPMSIELIENNSESEIRQRYLGMFDNMIAILKDRSEGYSHLRSLLETELPAVLGIMKKLSDYTEKPELLFYLFRECQMQPSGSLELLTEIEMLQKNILRNTDDGRSICKKLMLYQVQAMIKSQQQNVDRQEEAVKLCEEAEKIIQEVERRRIDSGKVILDKSIFIQQVQICLLKSRINGKIASIKEIIRCQELDPRDMEYGKKCNEQKKHLEQMKEELDRAKRLREVRCSRTGDAYGLLGAEINHQYGEYFFKQSQFFSENLKYRDRKETRQKRGLVRLEQESEKSNYKEAEKHYKEALDFYIKYPEQYRLQEAGVLRSLADLYCRMDKSGYYKEKDYAMVCYQRLEEAYMHYRSYNNLHGIADVMQSMGEMEDFSRKPEENRRSAICFYHAADKLYTALGDEWSLYVMRAFLGEAQREIEKVKNAKCEKDNRSSGAVSSKTTG